LSIPPSGSPLPSPPLPSPPGGEGRGGDPGEEINRRGGEARLPRLPLYCLSSEGLQGGDIQPATPGRNTSLTPYCEPSDVILREQYYLDFLVFSSQPPPPHMCGGGGGGVGDPKV